MTTLRQIESVDLKGREFVRYEFPYAMRLVIYDWLYAMKMFYDEADLVFKSNGVCHLDIYWKSTTKGLDNGQVD